MAKERFGKSRGPTREEIEREAKREVERLTRRSGAPTGGGGGFGAVASTPFESVAQNFEGATMRRRPSNAPEPPAVTPPAPQGYGGPIGVAGGRGRGAPSPYEDDDEAEYDEEGYDEEEEEEMAITEMALRDYAAQSGGRPEDHVVIPVDPASAEAMRDRAMQEFMERQAALRPPSEPGASRKPADGGVLGRLQAKRAEKEARVAQGLPEEEPGWDDDEDDDDRQAGVLSRIAARRRGEDAAPRAFTPPAREEKRSAPVFEGPVPEFVNVAARMSRNRPTPGGRPTKPAPARPSSRSPKRAAAKKAPAKKAPAKKAPARAPAKKVPAKKAPARAPAKKTPAKKVAAKKAPAKKAPAKKVAAKKAPARKAPSRRA